MHQEKSGSFKIYITQLHIIMNSLNFRERSLIQRLLLCCCNCRNL